MSDSTEKLRTPLAGRDFVPSSTSRRTRRGGPGGRGEIGLGAAAARMNTEVADAAESVGPPFHENDDAAGSAEGASLGRHGAPALRSLVDEGRAPMHRDGVAASSLAPETSHGRDAAAELRARAGGAKTPSPQALAGSGRRTNHRPTPTTSFRITSKTTTPATTWTFPNRNRRLRSLFGKKRGG